MPYRSAPALLARKLLVSKRGRAMETSEGLQLIDVITSGHRPLVHVFYQGFFQGAICEAGDVWRAKLQPVDLGDFRTLEEAKAAVSVWFAALALQPPAPEPEPYADEFGEMEAEQEQEPEPVVIAADPVRTKTAPATEGTPERRRRSALGPRAVRHELNEEQLVTMAALEKFGWELRFVRHPESGEVIPYVFDSDRKRYATLRPDGTIDEKTQVTVRK
jgi:hypothetical protein